MSLAARPVYRCGYCGQPTQYRTGGSPACAPGAGCTVPKRHAPVTETRLAPEPAQHAPELAVVVRWPRARVRPCVTPLCGRARAGTSTRCARCKRLERGRL